MDDLYEDQRGKLAAFEQLVALCDSVSFDEWGGKVRARGKVRGLTHVALGDFVSDAALSLYEKVARITERSKERK
jgi:hypothetical protein